jgi:hypothetical protein
VDQEEEMMRVHPELKAVCLTMAEKLNENLTRIRKRLSKHAVNRS